MTKCGKTALLSCMCRWSAGARSIITVTDTLRTEPGWERQSGWPAIWSPGEQPSPLLTCTTETAWLMRMGRSTLLCVIFSLPICCDLSDSEAAVACNPSLPLCSVSRMCRWGSITSRGDQKGKLLILQCQHNILWQDYPHPLTVQRQTTTC